MFSDRFNLFFFLFTSELVMYAKHSSVVGFVSVIKFLCILNCGFVVWLQIYVVFINNTLVIVVLIYLPMRFHTVYRSSVV